MYKSERDRCKIGRESVSVNHSGVVSVCVKPKFVNTNIYKELESERKTCVLGVESKRKREKKSEGDRAQPAERAYES